jgi:hypothetical protein
MEVLHGVNVLNKHSRTKGDPCPRLVLTSSSLLKPYRYELLHSFIREFIKVIKSMEMKRTGSTRRVGGGLFEKLHGRNWRLRRDGKIY